jgi:hypothetical protein
MTKKTKGLEGGRESREKGDTSSSCLESPIVASHRPESGVLRLKSTLVGSGEWDGGDGGPDRDRNRNRNELVVVLTAFFVVVAVAVFVLAIVVALVVVLVVFLVFATFSVLTLVLAFVVVLEVVFLVVLEVVVVMVLVLIFVAVTGGAYTVAVVAVAVDEGVVVLMRVNKLGRYPSIPACSRVRSLPQHSSCRLQASMVKVWSGLLRMISAPLMSFVHLAPLFACPAKGDLSDVACGVQEPSRLVPVKLR